MKIYKNEDSNFFDTDYDVITPIFETKEPLEMGPFGVDDKLYSVCVIDFKNDAAFVKKLKLINEETMCEDQITCPSCGNQNLDSWEMHDDGKEVCDYCYATFRYQREVIVEYDTKLLSHSPIKKVEVK